MSRLASPDVVKRGFAAGQVLDGTWVGDITYLRTWEGWAYLLLPLQQARFYLHIGKLGHEYVPRHSGHYQSGNVVHSSQPDVLYAVPP